MKVIRLSGKRAALFNAFAIVDDEDYERLTAMGSWYLSDMGYAVRRVRIEGGKKTVRMHRLLNHTLEGLVTDHINRNRLDNRKANLRTVTHPENMRNTDEGRGYYFCKQKKRWEVDCHRYNVKGVYVDTEADAIAYVAALRSEQNPVRHFTRRKNLSKAKLTPQLMRVIKEEFNRGKKRYQIAADLGVSPSCIGRFLSGDTWRQS